MDNGQMSTVPVLLGLVFYVAARTGRSLEDYSAFGEWRMPPRWARVVFGSVEGSISPYRLTFGAFGLSWMLVGAVSFAANPSPHSVLSRCLAGVALVFLVLAPVGSGVVWLIRFAHRLRAYRVANEAAVSEQALADSRLTLTYRLKYADFYWMWQTSIWGAVLTGIFLVGGLALLAAGLRPGQVVWLPIGLALLVAAPVGGPAIALTSRSGGLGLLGRTVRLVIDQDGLEGWPSLDPLTTRWDRLRHCRLESQVLVLAFRAPAAQWVVLPARAFTTDDFGRLLAILRGRGFLLDGDHRSALGRLVDLRGGPGQQNTDGGHMTSFPRLRRR